MKIIEDEVMRTSIKWEDLDYLEGTRLIVLNRSAKYCRDHKLNRVLPVRRGRTGTRPGVTGKGPLGPDRGDQEQWCWPRVKLTEEERVMVVAEVVKILAEVMFTNHLYTFGGRTYRQKKGGPIGLRGTCALARLVMCNGDRLWEDLMKKNRVTIEDYMRYMDEGRTFLHPFKHGWRWVDGGLKYRETWRVEDLNKTAQEITENILRTSMQGIYPSLRFTTEVGEGAEGWLPTLDIMVRVESSNTISYRYYEKPTTTNTMVQKRTALCENSKNQILSNDLVRRLANTDDRQPDTVKQSVLDQFAKKALTSGYSLV